MSIYAARHTFPLPGQTSNLHVQGTLHLRVMFNRTILTNAEIGPSPGTSGNKTVPSLPISTKPQTIRLCTSELNILLPPNPYVYPRHKHTCA